VQEAVDVLDRCLADVLRRIEPGQTERDVARMVELCLIEHADGSSFPPIVASGPNASVPHAAPSDRRTHAGEGLKIDIGALARGWHLSAGLGRGTHRRYGGPRRLLATRIVRLTQESGHSIRIS